MKINIDLPSLLKHAERISEDAPALLAMAQSRGLRVPPVVASNLPWLGVLSQLAQKYVNTDGSGLDIPGLPDTGPRGRGRTSYLLKRDQYRDVDVVSVVDGLLQIPGLEAAPKIKATVEYTCACMFPKQTGYTDTQRRMAIDQILVQDMPSPKFCDRLGDLLYFGLTHPPPTESK